ncbi:phage tail protein [Phenylobacterium sp.]|uniref:phage tail protein n=1 Tax=Phenylobacterium sp. TaxID=1871053 RepID=UPI002733D95A|nr:phage tail protein [Phenylobacterium sp.]MDP3853146.1 phage tail protein [Phenylobacterium sp.]
MIGFFLAALAILLVLPTVAHAEPVSTAIVSFFALTGTAAAVATFVINAVVSLAISAIANRLLSPSQRTSGQERQASVMSLTLGEAPREVIFGLSATGGQLLDAFNFGGQYGTDWEVQIVAVADHKCESLEGFFIGDTYYAYAADGVQSGFNSQLEVYWKDGSWAQAASSYLVTNSSGRWTSTERAAGVAYIVFAYKADAPNATSPVWSTGRPSFKALVKGKRCYDPRLDTTVDGGSGAHRWDDPDTWAWTDNAAICAYNYRRGVYAGDQVEEPEQLLIGRGLTAEEAQPVRIFAAANLCDEAVTLLAGGTEPRYRANGVIRADEPFIVVEEYFAAAMAGVIVQRDGGVEIEPGAAKSVVTTITDADLVVGEAVQGEDFLSDTQRVNLVTPRYIAPDQLWQDHAAPVRRSVSDIVADGGQRAKTLTLSMVTSQTQAQRCGEIERRLGRQERRYSLVLGPRFSWLEDGDWLAWQSDRRFLGSTITFRVENVVVGEDHRTSLVLRQINSSCYAWTAATDEGTPGAAPVDEAGSLDPLELDGVDIETFQYVGDNGQEAPGVIAHWDTPVDAAIMGVRLEVRVLGSAEVAATLANDPAAGVMTSTNGIAPDTPCEGRLVPISTEGRRVTASSWIALAPGDLAARYLLSAGGALKTFEEISAALSSIPAKNLLRKQDWVPFATAVLVDPMTVGDAKWGFTLPGNSNARVEGGSGRDFDHTGEDLLAAYSASFKAKVSSGTATLRAGWRDASGNALSDVPDQTFPLTTTAKRFTWPGMQSADPDLNSGHFRLFVTPADATGGQTISVTDLQMEFGPTTTNGWRPSPDDVDLLRYAGYLGSLIATRNEIFRQSTTPASPQNGDVWVDTTVSGGDVIKVYSGVTSTWYVASTVGGAFGSNLYHTPGGTLATLSNFLTSVGTSAAFTGQAAWATHTAKTPAGSLQFLGEDGKISNVQGLGAVTSGFGQALVLDHFPMTADDTHIYIDSFVVKGFPSYTRSISGYTFSSMPPGNSWHILLYWPTGGFGLASNVDLNGYLATGDWLFLGTMATSSSAVFPPPPASPPGYYGGGAGDPYVFQP